MTALEKGCVRSLFCHAAHMRSRNRGPGYEIYDVCELYGEAEGTLGHRLWRCACKDARGELVPAEVRQWAEEADDVLAFLEWFRTQVSVCLSRCTIMESLLNFVLATSI